MTKALLLALGLREVRQIVGGHQSLGVYAARLDEQPEDRSDVAAGGRRVVVKLVDARHVDLDVLTTRARMLSQLGANDGAVCRPVALSGRLVNEVRLAGGAGTAGAAYAVAYELAEGDPPSVTDPGHAALLGRALADLHASLRPLPRFDLPPLAAFPPRPALAGVAAELGAPLDRLPHPAGPDGDLGTTQLLHGDFSRKNVRIDGPDLSRPVRIFDFDDCGYGPVELDIALALYMVLFGTVTGSTPATYTTFRAGFLGGYRARAAVDISDATIDGLITYRVLALASWLRHPGTAPAGVRTASPEWRGTLGRFVEDHVDRTFRQ